MADDHQLIREGLKTLLGFEEDLRIVGEAINGQEAIRTIEALRPDVVLMDVNMPNRSGIEVLRSIKEKHPSVKFIIITAAGDRETLFEAIESGADGYILKDSESIDLIEAIHEVFLGESYIDKRLVRYLVNKLVTPKGPLKNKLLELTDRELEILKAIAEGHTNKEIAEIFFLSEKTIKNYATNIYRKLEVKDRVQATLYAIRNHIQEL